MQIKSLQPDSDVLKEPSLRANIDNLEKTVQTRLVGEEIPDKYEKKALSEFEKKRKTGKLEFMLLS